MSWFGWLTKSHMEVTGLDKLIASLELFAIVIPVLFIWGYLDTKRIAKIKKRHGKHCTCFTCMGVSR